MPTNGAASLIINELTMNDLLRSYFPTLSEKQLTQFEALGSLYSDWNAKINVISRKDIDMCCIPWPSGAFCPSSLIHD